VMIAADLARAALLLMVPVAAYFDRMTIGLLCVVAFAMGTFTILFDIGYLSYLPSLVRRAHLVEANSRLEATASVAQVMGSGLGGTLVDLLSGPAAILLDAISFLWSALFLRWIRKPEPQPERSEDAGSMRSRIAEGLSFVTRHPVLRALAGCSAVTNLFGNAFLAVYVAFMVRELGLSEAAIGFVFATGGVGAFVGSVLANRLLLRFGEARTLIGAQTAFGLTGLLVPVAVLFPAVDLPMVVAAEFLQWMTLLIYIVNAISLRQRLTSDEMQGRLHATFAFVARGAQPIGSILGGIVASIIGLAPTLVVAELGMFVAVAWLVASPLRSAQGQRVGPIGLSQGATPGD
jgi:predicted MFS family arabinose efflux permease